MNIDVVVKIGGSLGPKHGCRLCNALASLLDKHRVLVVPGGWRFADLVRYIDVQFQFSADVAHNMALLAMDQYGLLLSDVCENAVSVRSLDEAFEALEKNKLPVLLASSLVIDADELVPSWDVTSDTIAAFIAERTNAQKLIIATDVDGIFIESRLIETIPAEKLAAIPKKTCVDRAIPKFLIKHKLNCWVVNGKSPERAIKIINSEETIYTKILG